MLTEVTVANVLVSPDLAEAFGIFLGAPASKVANRHRLQINVYRVVGGIHLLAATIPLAPISLVALAAAGCLAKHAKSRIFAHAKAILPKLVALPHRAPSLISPLPLTVAVPEHTRSNQLDWSGF